MRVRGETTVSVAPNLDEFRIDVQVMHFVGETGWARTNPFQEGYAEQTDALFLKMVDALMGELYAPTEEILDALMTQARWRTGRVTGPRLDEAREWVDIIAAAQGNLKATRALHRQETMERLRAARALLKRPAFPQEQEG